MPKARDDQEPYLFPLLANRKAHHLHNAHHHVQRGHRHVEPTEIVKEDAGVHELLGPIRKAALLVAVAAQGVLAGLLQVDDGAHAVRLKLLENAVLVQQTRRRTLHGQHIFGHPRTVQAADGARLGLAAPVLALARGPAAKEADDRAARLFVRVPRGELGFAHGAGPLMA
jgi:hypothetical protein